MTPGSGKIECKNSFVKIGLTKLVVKTLFKTLRQNLNLSITGWNSNYNKAEYTRNLVIYDYGSVMHYGKFDEAKKPFLPAIEVKN